MPLATRSMNNPVILEAHEPLAAVLEARFPWCLGWEAELRALFAGYVETKQAGHVLDYDDLLLYWAQMAAEPEIAAHLGSRFDHVLVDEYQDTNRLQASILLALKPDGAGLTVVGEHWHRFPAAADGSPGGITGMLLLAESHVALHSWPELAAVTLDVYVCNYGGDNSAKARALMAALVALFEPAEADLQSLERGRPAPRVER